jgi:hypothetical protein
VIDLNTFTWFFTDDNPSTARAGAVEYAAFLSIGFFVRRSVWSEPTAFEQCSRIEVSHVLTTFNGGEHGVSWFFHTVGSGIFLDCTQLPTRGRTVVYRDRRDFSRVEHRQWENDRDFPKTWMGANGVAMIIFTQADFAIYGLSSPGHRSPRAEILVKLENNEASELGGGDRGVCLEGPGLRVKLFAGWHGATRCVCSPLHKGGNDFLHCEH